MNGDYREFTLENGLRVGLQQTPTEVAYGHLRVFHGAANEQPGQEGLAHFLEHSLISGGTEKYSPQDVERIAGRFAYHNANTSLDETSFFVDMLSDDVASWLDFASEVVFAPRFDAKHVEEERARVLREIAERTGGVEYEDCRDTVWALYRNLPQSIEVYGKKAVIESVNPDALRQFHAQGYSPNNADLVLVGGLPPNIEELVKQSFSLRVRGSGTRFTFPEPPPLQKRVHLYKPISDRGHGADAAAELTITTLVPNTKSPHRYPIALASWVLGGDTNSRLHKRLSHRLGLSYDVKTFLNLQYNGGILTIQGRFHAQRLEEAGKAIFEEIERLQSNGILEEELDRTKRSSRHYIAKQFETNQGHAAAIQERWDDGTTPHFRMERFAEVTAIAAQEAAQKFFPSGTENPHYVVLIRNPLIPTVPRWHSPGNVREKG